MIRMIYLNIELLKWNNLEEDLKNSKTLNIFKSKVTQYNTLEKRKSEMAVSQGSH